MQLPAQAVAQQTPCAHAPLVQSVSAAHPAPLAFRPHDPLSQVAGATQSALDAHVDLHAEPPHWNAPHELDAGVAHFPPPLQVAAGVNVFVPAGQLAPLQAVPDGYSWHAPAPSHLPSVPHEAAPWSTHEPAGSGMPAGTLRHCPTEPASAHDLHAPLQAVAQQTPWAHTPDAHCVPLLQAAPF
ncbi:MAG: hypothetical protein ABUS79_08625, partial [Pseudomonadota bacterium]